MKQVQRCRRCKRSRFPVELLSTENRDTLPTNRPRNEPQMWYSVHAHGGYVTEAGEEVSDLFASMSEDASDASRSNRRLLAVGTRCGHDA